MLHVSFQLCCVVADVVLPADPLDRLRASGIGASASFEAGHRGNRPITRLGRQCSGGSSAGLGQHEQLPETPVFCSIPPLQGSVLERKEARHRARNGSTSRRTGKRRWRKRSSCRSQGWGGDSGLWSGAELASKVCKWRLPAGSMPPMASAGGRYHQPRHPTGSKGQRRRQASRSDARRGGIQRCGSTNRSGPGNGGRRRCRDAEATLVGCVCAVCPKYRVDLSPPSRALQKHKPPACTQATWPKRCQCWRARAGDANKCCAQTGARAMLLATTH